MKKGIGSKRIMAALLAVWMLCVPLTACGGAPEEADVICTTFAAYDWVRNLLGEDRTLTVDLLVSDGSDVHSYQPTVADKIRLSESRLVIYMGGESDRWVSELLADTKNEVEQICLSEIDGVTLHTVSAEGEGTESAHTHEHGEGEDHDHEAFDEHLWLSPMNALTCTEYIAAALSRLAPEAAETYEQNLASYREALQTLSADYRTAVEQASVRKLLFADRFPFVYLTEEYGIAYCAAFEGCSTENEASFDTIVRLGQKADEWGLRYVMVTETSDRKLAQSVIDATAGKDQQILCMESMQSVSRQDVEQGVSYLSVMYENLDVLRLALS